MKINRLFFTATFLFFFNVSFANLIQATKIRGNATFLSNGMLEAKPVVLNQWLSKDTSILTSEKTFIILKYKNGSEITLGPNSKLVVDQGTKADQQIISLLLGKFKASVKNQAKSNDNKMIIKTTGAALGIRGTEFQASYNPQTKITSLLTFHGAVAMAKIDNPIHANSKSTIEIEKKLILDSVVVKTGEYSGVTENIKLVTAPVKISPEQFTKLKLNQTLGAIDEQFSEKEFKEELNKTETAYIESKKDKNTDTVKDSFKARPGGFIDMTSGLYLPPPKSAIHDDNLNIFKTTEKMGKIDNIGTYTPPTGLTLNPNNGFSVDEKAATVESIALAVELNEAVSKQVVKEEPIIKKKSKLEPMEHDVYKKYYDPNKI